MLDQPLHEIRRLRSAGAAVRPRERGVGEHALRHQVHGLDVVGLGDKSDRERAGGERRVDEPGAHLEQRLRAQRQDLAAVVERELAVIDHLAAVRIVHHAFGARGDPLHWVAELLRRPHHQQVVGIGAALEAEAAADVRRDDADLVLRHVEDVADLHAHAMRVLRSGIQRVLVGRGLVVADRDARLHRDRRYPVVLHAQLDDVLGLGEGGVGRLGAAEHQAERGIAHLVVVVDLGRALFRGILDVDHGFERLVFDRDQFGAVARLRFRFRDDERDAVADAAHFVGDQQRQERAVALRRAEILRHQVRGHAGELVGGDVGAGEDGEHAGRRLRLGNVDLLDAGVGMRRQHVDAEGHAGQHNVVDVAALANEEALVLDSAHRLSDSELGHGVPPAALPRC